jgi:hypothetical protein
MPAGCRNFPRLRRRHRTARAHSPTIPARATPAHLSQRRRTRSPTESRPHAVPARRPIPARRPPVFAGLSRDAPPARTRLLLAGLSRDARPLDDRRRPTLYVLCPRCPSPCFFFETKPLLNLNIVLEFLS